MEESLLNDGELWYVVVLKMWNKSTICTVQSGETVQEALRKANNYAKSQHPNSTVQVVEGLYECGTHLPRNLN